MINKIKNKIHIPKFIIRNRLKISLGIVSILTIIMLVLCITPGNNIVKIMGRKILEGLRIYTYEIEDVWIESEDYGEPGSWEINKSARWTSADTAQIKLDLYSYIKSDVNKIDVILVLDKSASMEGDKLYNVSYDSMELVSHILSDRDNNVALVTFGDEATIETDFTNYTDEVNSNIYYLSAGGRTNYDDALKKVDEIMSDYTKQPNREVVTLFLTDGYPDINNPNQIGTYEVLKEKYPYMTIQGIQYEMGLDNVINEIKDVSDNQWIANQDNLINVLFDASIGSIKYEKFIITDYIDNDYFTVESENDIEVSMGTATLEEESGKQKVVWNLGENKLYTGGMPNMKIGVKLKSQYVGEEGYYPTNRSIHVSSKLEGDTEKSLDETETPVLRNLYDVIYDTNTPTGCSLPDVASETHYVYQTVNKKTDELYCNGYIFKGWQIYSYDDRYTTKINDDTFIMPDRNVRIKATWGKQAVTKSMDGEVVEKTTLYKVLEDEAKTGTYAKRYGYSHEDSIDKSKSTKNIYMYKDSSSLADEVLNRSNVIFADQCWNMYRTTDTGGVKLVYNGEAVDNQCLNNRGSHVGYAGFNTSDWVDNYWYGTDYIYNSDTGEFSLSGTKSQRVANGTKIDADLVGQYTCKSTNEFATCSTLYMVADQVWDLPTVSFVSINANSSYYQFGTLEYNQYFSSSPANVGYMYGKIYNLKNTVDIPIKKSTADYRYSTYYKVLDSQIYKSSAVDWWYADSFSYDNGNYTLDNPYQITSTNDIGNAVGKYAYKTTAPTSELYYIAGYNNSYLDYKILKNGNSDSDYYITLADSYTYDGVKTYTLENPIHVSLSEWYTNHENYRFKYKCDVDPLSTSTTCNYSIKLVTYTNPKELWSKTTSRNGDLTMIMIGKERDGNNTLIDTLLVSEKDFISNTSNYSDYKYTCFTDNSNCTAENIVRIAENKLDHIDTYPNYYLASSVTWDGTKYTLVNPLNLLDVNDFTENNFRDTLNNYPYACLESNASLTCTKVAKIISYTPTETNPSSSTGLGTYYIELEDGDLTHADSMKRMTENNTNNSLIKTGLDAWYKHYLLPYDKYIDDVIYCNERTINSLPFWNDTVTKKISSYIQFGVVYNAGIDCKKQTDKFSVSNPLAPLTYKIGLLTKNEVNSAIRKNHEYWTMSPGLAGMFTSPDMDVVGSNWEGTYWESGVNPVIALKANVEYSDGDGSMEHPYIIDTSS